MNYFQYDPGYLHCFKPAQDGISQETAEKITHLIQTKNLGWVLVFLGDHKIITYGLLDSKGVMIDYFYNPYDLLTHLQQD